MGEDRGERAMTHVTPFRIMRGTTLFHRDAGMDRNRNGWVRLGLLFLGLLLPVLVLATPAAADDGVHHAALAIRYEDGSTQTSCVAFSEDSITGEELMQRAGLTLIADYSSSIGNAVCSINGQGCAYPAEDCFCRCQGV